MAATSLTVTTITPGGAVLPALGAVDAVNGNTFPNTGREAIEIANGAGAPITVTFTTTGSYTTAGGSTFQIADSPVTVTNGTSKSIGPFEVGLFSSTVTIAWSSGTTVTARVTSLGAA
jgi:hypothetical protein